MKNLFKGESWYGTDAPVWALIGLLLALLILVAGLLASPRAQACDPGNFYDPAHQVCAPYAPTNCPPQYWQACAYPGGHIPQPWNGPGIDRPELSPPPLGVS